MFWSCVGVFAIVLSSCAADDAGVPGADDFADAMCDDLRAGKPLVETFGPDDLSSVQVKAQVAYMMAGAGCPEELKTNQALRKFLRQNGIDPDR